MMMLSKTELKERAYARLDETDRACDGCEGRIGRWTSKCHYVPEIDRAYCSTGGCAEAVIAAPLCAGEGCETYLNPFAVESKDVPGMGLMCSTCASSIGGAEEALEALDLLDPSGVKGLSKTERRAIEDGPYVVAASPTDPRWYQVVLPLTATFSRVRSTGNDPERLFRLCASFNLAHA